MPTVAPIEQIVSHTATTFDDWTLISPASPSNRDGVFIHAIDQDMAVKLQSVEDDAPADGYLDDTSVATFIVPAGKTVYVGIGEKIAVYGSAAVTAGDCVVTEVV